MHDLSATSKQRVSTYHKARTNLATSLFDQWVGIIKTVNTFTFKCLHFYRHFCQLHVSIQCQWNDITCCKYANHSSHEQIQVFNILASVLQLIKPYRWIPHLYLLLKCLLNLCSFVKIQKKFHTVQSCIHGSRSRGFDYCTPLHNSCRRYSGSYFVNFEDYFFTENELDQQKSLFKVTILEARNFWSPCCTNPFHSRFLCGAMVFQAHKIW